MKITRTIYLLPLCAAILLAQGPRGGGFGPGGPGGGFGGFGGRGPDVRGAGPGSQALVTGAPYSATETLTMQQTLVGNQISRKQQSTVARDSMGRISTSETVTPAASTGKPAYTIQTIFDPVAGYRYELNSSTMVAMQSPLPKMTRGMPRTPRTPPSGSGDSNRVTTNLGTKTVNGESCAGTQITETIPAGAIGNAQPIQVTRVTWVSTELKVPVEIQSSDPRFGSSDLELTNIVHADPNPNLFLVPAGYAIQQGGRGGRGPGGAGGAAGRRGPGPNARRQPPQ